MNAKQLSLALSLIVAAFPLPALSNDDVVEQIGDWTVTARTNHEYAVNQICILTSSEDDPKFILTNVPDDGISGPTRGSARLDLRLPGNLLSDNNIEIDSIRVAVPNHFTWTGSKESMTESRSNSALRIVVFIDPRIDAVIPPLARGNNLLVEIEAGGDSTTHTFALAGSYRAMVAYEKCLANVKWIEGGSGS